jgi:hypothetical protein
MKTSGTLVAAGLLSAGIVTFLAGIALASCAQQQARAAQIDAVEERGSEVATQPPQESSRAPKHR